MPESLFNKFAGLTPPVAASGVLYHSPYEDKFADRIDTASK